MNYNKRTINLISSSITLLIILVIFAITNTNQYKKISKQNLMEKEEIFNEEKQEFTEIKQESSKEDDKKEKIEFIKNEVNEGIKDKTESIKEAIISKWEIQISKLNLKTTIKEGTSKEIIENNVGHYESSIVEGNNVALLAYNSGEKNNYFSNLKELNIDDEIIYIVNQNTYKYKVKSNIIIDKEEVENTINKTGSSEKTIKLFTYVIDLPNKMRCVIAE